MRGRDILNNNINTKKKTRELAQLALLTAIIIIMAFVPYLGYIPLGFMNATIIHIPVIIGGVFLGPKAGGILGFIFGLTSLYNNTFNPNITSFVFSPFYTAGGVNGGIRSLIVCFVPRILIGIVAYYSYRFIVKNFGNKAKIRTIGFTLAGVMGSITNTILVMSGIYILFGETYALARGLAVDALYKVIFAVIGTQGVPEAIVAGGIVTILGKALYKVNKNM